MFIINVLGNKNTCLDCNKELRNSLKQRDSNHKATRDLRYEVSFECHATEWAKQMVPGGVRNFDH